MNIYQYAITKNNVEEVRKKIYETLTGKYCNVSTRPIRGELMTSLGVEFTNCFSRYFGSETQVIEFSSLEVLFNIGSVVQFQDDWILIQDCCDQTLTGIQILSDFWVK